MSIFNKLLICVGLPALCAIIAICISVISSWKVEADAERIAGSQPYCVQVADRSTADYRPALSSFDLSILSMRALQDSSFSLHHHAILVVGSTPTPQLYHWSYFQQAFQPGVHYGVKGPVLTCLPEQNFARSLPAFWRRPIKFNYVKFLPDEAYRIPIIWRAKWSGGESRSLVLATAAPDFQPIASDNFSVPTDASQVFIEWNPEWVNSLLHSKYSDKITSRTSFEGLTKTTYVEIGTNGVNYYMDQYVFEEQSSSDNITVISCYESSGRFSASCQHRFVNRGRHFYFRHAPTEVKNWSAMQHRVLDLMASFEESSTSR